MTYLVYDEPEVVEECLSVMRKRDMETLKYTLNTPAEAVLFFEDSSTTNISPAFFNRYMAPQVKVWAEKVHQSGKYLIHHACRHIKDLLSSMAQCNVDVIESISPPATGNIELADARKLLPDTVGLIGGIEPTFFERCAIHELDAYVERLLHDMAGSRFILANSDSCPPGVTHEKLKYISEIVRRK